MEEIKVVTPSGDDSLEEQDVDTDKEDGDESSSVAKKGFGRLRKGGTEAVATSLTGMAIGQSATNEIMSPRMECFRESVGVVGLHEPQYDERDKDLIPDGDGNEFYTSTGLLYKENDADQNVNKNASSAIENAIDGDTGNEQEASEQTSLGREDVNSEGNRDMVSKDQAPDEEDEEEILKALMGDDSGISEELEEEEGHCSSSIEKSESESGDSSANINQDTEVLKSTSVAFKPAKTGTLDLAVVLERIKRKADRAAVPNGVREKRTLAPLDNEEKDATVDDQEVGFAIEAVEDATIFATVPKGILERLEKKRESHEISREEVNWERNDQYQTGFEVEAGKLDENVEYTIKDDTKADDDPDGQGLHSECSDGPDLYITDNAEEVDKEEREFLEETRLRRQIEKDDMNSCAALEFRSQLSGSFLVEDLMDNSRSRPLSNPVFQASGNGGTLVPSHPDEPLLGKAKKRQAIRTLLDSCKPGPEVRATVSRTNSLNQTLSKSVAAKRPKIFVYASNEGSKDAGSRGPSQTKHVQESKGKENNASHAKQHPYNGKRSLFELVTSEDQTPNLDNTCALSELNSALGHVRKTATGPR